MPLADRMATFAGKEGECWDWPGFVNPRTGYATTSAEIDGVTHKRLLVHRGAYMIAKGPIGDGLTIDHLCRNRRCFNPAHMEAVSHRENNLRSNSPSALNAVADECINGHPFTDENTLVQHIAGRRPKRRCRQCDRDRAARDREKPEVQEYRRQWWKANGRRYPDRGKKR